ncbi:AAA family ATPase [Streptomyces sp. NPDC058001]|uniref:helix-turn-helix transcriptional regulator n=1 Tax=Streptomyces sp. NPDC058001 TaxID=3346300 RepID=UPI0036F13ADE
MILVNREVELGLLTSGLAECAAGRAKMIVVEGGVGCGKSELLDTFTEFAAEQGAAVLRGMGIRSASDQPLALLRQLLGQVPGWVPSEPGVAEQEFGDALHRLAGRGPVVVCVDDAQYGDSRSLHYLLQAAGFTRSARILLVFGDSLHLPHRDPMIKTELLRQSNSLRIRLGPLSKHGTAAMLAAQGGDAADRPLVDRLHFVTAGNPLLLRALLEECRPSTAGSGVADEIEPMEGGLYGQAVLASLYRSGPAALELGHALAVLDEPRATEILPRLVDQPSALIDQNLQALTAAGVIAGTAFRHQAAVATVLADLPPGRGTTLHRGVAVALHSAGYPASVIARHLLKARSAVEPWELIALRNAAEEALAEDDAVLAIDCLELAYGACPDPVQRIEIKMRLALITWRTNPAAAEYRHLPELLSAMRQGELSPTSLGMLGKLLSAHGRIEEAMEVLRLGDDALFEAHRPVPGIHPTIASMWVRHGFHGVDFPDSGHRGDAAEGPAVPGSPVNGSVPGIPLLRKSAEDVLIDAQDWSGSAENFLEMCSLTDSMVAPVCSALKALLYSDQVEAAAQWCAKMLDEATRRNIPGWQGLLATVQGMIALRQGRLEEAVASASLALEVVPERNGSVLVCGTSSILAMAYTEMGRYDAAVRLLDQPVSQDWFGSVYWLGYLRARGHFHLATNRSHAALSDFLRIGKMAGSWGIDHPMLVSWRTDAAQAWLQLGEPSQAQQLLDAEVSQDFPGYGRLRGIILRLQAAIAPLADRVQLLTRAVEEFDAGNDRLELAKALADLSEAHQALGNQTRADLVRRKGRHLAGECGAEPLYQRMAAGGRNRTVAANSDSGHARPEPKPGVELTEAEYRVASLASYGHTNREISQQLYITVSTVEQHLTRIYQKLRITRRQEIPVDL